MSLHLRRWLKGLEPRVLAQLDGPMMRRLRPWVDRHDVLSFKRHPLALGVAIGMFCGLIPGPLQVAGTLLLCAWWRGNVVAGAVATFYTNPLTIVPLYAVAFELGQWVLPGSRSLSMPPMPADGHWLRAMGEWMMSLGWPLAVGLPLLGLSLAVLAWTLVQVAWLAPVWRRLWLRRRARRQP